MSGPCWLMLVSLPHFWAHDLSQRYVEYRKLSGPCRLMLVSLPQFWTHDLGNCYDHTSLHPIS